MKPLRIWYRQVFEDSLSDEAYALFCQPLKVGLGSEARSTTYTLAKSEGRQDGGPAYIG